MIEIDGSIGGGQVLRTSLALSTITGKSFQIENIRKNRSDSGIKPQHLTGIQSISELCDANTDGAELGSQHLRYKPGDIKPSKIKARIETAGSIGLLLQTLILPSSKASKEIKIDVKGGSTFSKWSPPLHFFKRVLKPHLESLGVNFNLKIKRNGFYPKGGARVEAKVEPCEEIRSMDLTERGKLKSIQGISIASNHLKDAKVAERQKKKAHKLIANEFPSLNIEIKFKYVNSVSPGSGIVMNANYKNTVIGADSIGEKGKRSEKVGREAAGSLLESIKSEKCLDKYIGDQILPFLALSDKKSHFTVSEVTEHIETNLKVIEKFLDIKSKIKGNKIEIDPC